MIDLRKNNYAAYLQIIDSLLSLSSRKFGWDMMTMRKTEKKEGYREIQIITIICYIECQRKRILTHTRAILDIP